jgi:prepilin-type N-terminal cleavage/methylation domain-containing protein
MKKTLNIQHNSAGFTLAELVVTVSIIAILAALATPDLIYSLDLRRLQAAANEYHMTLQRARAVAIKSRGNCIVAINANQCTLTCANEPSLNSTTTWNSYSDKLTLLDSDGNPILAAPDKKITFKSRGTAGQLQIRFRLAGINSQYQVRTFITGAIKKEQSSDGATWY